MKRAVLTVEEMGELLGLGRSKAYELVNSRNAPPVVRVGRCIRIPKDGFMKWLEEQSANRAVI